MAIVLVKMKARAYTDGNTDDVRDRVFTAPLDPELIGLAGSNEEAVEIFRSAAPYISEVISCDYFEISKCRYTWDHSKRGWNTRNV